MPTGECSICGLDVVRNGKCSTCRFNAYSNMNYPQIALVPGTDLSDSLRVVGVLGEPGGFGVVYLVWDRLLHTHVAVKEFFPRQLVGRTRGESLLTPHTSRDLETYKLGLESFINEARVLAKLHHSNLVRVRSVVEQFNTAYLVMDYYEGCTLEALAQAKGGRIEPELAIAIFVRLLDGLRQVHELKYLHRDIKPSNIYIRADGHPILLDFGAARLLLGERSQSLSVVLTPGFAPPEQYSRQGRQGNWTDLYAVSATLYRVLTGQVPQDAMDRLVQDQLLSPDRLVSGLDPRLAGVIMRGLALRAEDRYTSAQQFSSELLGQGFRGQPPPLPSGQGRPSVSPPPIPPTRPLPTAPSGPPPLLVTPPSGPPQLPAAPTSDPVEWVKNNKGLACCVYLPLVLFFLTVITRC